MTTLTRYQVKAALTMVDPERYLPDELHPLDELNNAPVCIDTDYLYKQYQISWTTDTFNFYPGIPLRRFFRDLEPYHRVDRIFESDNEEFDNRAHILTMITDIINGAKLCRYE